MRFAEFASLIDNFNAVALEIQVNQYLPTPYRNGSFHVASAFKKDGEHMLDNYSVLVKEFFEDNDPRSFPIPVAAIEFKWNYCPSCRQVRNKSLVGYHRDENMVHLRELVRHGEII